MRLENVGHWQGDWMENSAGPETQDLFSTYYAAACFSMFALLRNYRLQMNISSGGREAMEGDGGRRWKGERYLAPGTFLLPFPDRDTSPAIFN